VEQWLVDYIVKKFTGQTVSFFLSHSFVQTRKKRKKVRNGWEGMFGVKKDV